jgi:uncharacterized surface protein with fasciclin (FAS1) repeats
MKKSLQLFLVAIVALGMLGIVGCGEDHQERFDDPPWLGGSSIETLEKAGNYSIFLKLMERANYTDAITKQLFTLFVPNDDAFNAYFQKANIDSVGALSEEEALELFTLHVLRNPRSRYFLIYEYVWGEFQGPKGEYASLFHRKATPSTGASYLETVRYASSEETVGTEFRIKVNPKFVPLWSAEFFQDYGGAADGSDYLFMYPQSTWEKDYTDNLKGLNWHSAAVIPNPDFPNELEVRTASGFIYYLDRVVEPIPSIEQYLKDQPQFSVFYDMMQRFARYTAAGVDPQQRTLKFKTYSGIFDLALERASSTNTTPPPQNMWTAFIPNNTVFNEYLNNTVLKYYSSLDEVPMVTLEYILQTQLAATLATKSKINKGYINSFGEITDYKVSDIASAYMCSNGIIYESKKVMDPNVFTTVPGELFVNKDYSTLLHILGAANVLSSLANPNVPVTLFASTNEALEAYGIRYDEPTKAIQFRSPANGIWKTMDGGDLTAFAQEQAIRVPLDAEALSGSEKFYETLSQSFIKVANNEVFGAENLTYNTPAKVLEVVPNDKNGYLVKVDRPIAGRFVMGQRIAAGTPAAKANPLWFDPDFSEFAALLVKAGKLETRTVNGTTLETIPNLKILGANEKYWTALIPTNAAIEQARAEGIIPAKDKYPTTTAGKDSMINFLYYHFVIGNVIFDDGNGSGDYRTFHTYKETIDGKEVILNSTVNFVNTPNNLTITDLSGNVIQLDHADANVLVRKGVVHKINSVLKYYKD